ncbi:non-ribosomal peptide synthetase [Saccharothrix obliqua]|uniref:non-ribosomal peptide synthetase n=1 Tax=Saccharothrix obliqua TaxID=2861747 RepID=UPI001C5DBFC8|nr:non-ribosomal peptide synthetase [Saccharothrix obliqua]MBW4718323.1 amino acid adenylation domain-containing protein [Saccharothrix obliqua]
MSTLLPTDRARVPRPVRRTAVVRVPRPGGHPVTRFAEAFAELLRRYTGRTEVTYEECVLLTADDGARRELTVVVGDDLTARYDADLFDEGTIRRLLGHLGVLLDDPDGALPTPAEQRLLLVAWNDTAAPVPEGCVHHRFEARAAAQPDAAAVVRGDRAWTYDEVNRAANRLARRLRGLGVGPDVRVGLGLDRSPDLLVAVLGVLKAGGAYVPLDPGYPPARLAGMGRGADLAVLVTRTDLAVDLPGTPTVLLDRDPLPGPDTDLDGGAGPDDLCYVIFTSGSTGAPKGIALRHRGVLNNLVDLNTRYAVGPGDRVLGLSSPSFDMSVYELLGMTIAGGTLVLTDADPATWARELVDRSITVWNSAPALLELVLERLAGPLPAVRLVLLGGDWVAVSLPDRLRRHAPGARVVVMGGATESSIHTTLYEVERVDPAWTSIPYGRPMANQRVYVLDERMRPVPVGVPGELHLAGVGLARGYLGQPELTAEKFVTWSWGPVRERLYRTGDLVRYRPDGRLELLGRLDFQVKVNGLRVELGEVEAALRRVLGTPDVVVAAATDPTGDRRLVGYAVGAFDPAGVRAELAAVLPRYLVPAVVVPVDRLPLSPNGKVDRRALPAPVWSAGGESPADEVEEHIAAVWRDHLGVAEIGRDADFFALGGDSMKALRVVREIDPALTMADLFAHPTVRDLARRLRG